MLSARQRIILSVLVITSIVLCLLAAALQAGYEHPIQNSDSHGNQLGFNNPLTWELYGVLLKSASLKSVSQMLGCYGMIYLFFHLVALLFFAANSLQKANRAIASGFFLQLLIFPMGLPGLLFFPLFVYVFFTNKIDGEVLTDMPFVFWHLFEGFWFAVSFTAGVLIWKNAKKVLLSEVKSSASPRLCGS